ncbi:MAG: GNAT family N-acetyltransferase [Betaproteobacteria bacterium]|jgi:CelD/BcsL family acetyltransferase involved in cellulose biosynthesis|nr:GNAT family N-acetyltransferase [Rubrivivax sp.]MCZ8174298.1 GNAT family N-acetyltransferase [Burkholderiaceae bacterium]
MPTVAPVTIAFRLSDLTLARIDVPLLTVRMGIQVATPSDPDPSWSLAEIPDSARGVIVREWAVEPGLPTVRRVGGCLRYVMKQYRHCFIDMSGSFEGYKSRFSSKTRSTIARKRKKFADHCGGELRWTVHRTEPEVRQFLDLAVALAARTYQEKLLGLGLPGTEEFAAWAADQARQGRIRAFLLYGDEKPVSYLFCPIHEGVVEYAYLGYDPEYRTHSVGTVLQWIALEHLFGEQSFRFFDFTEGESDHKRLFATHERLCANVLFVRAGWRGYLLVYAHHALNRVSEGLGALLDMVGLRARLRQYLRFGLTRN